ncbi:MAG: hypothetical protein ACXWEU_08205 [Methylomonas sp.]
MPKQPIIDFEEGLKMEITTTYPKQNTLIKPGSSTYQKKTPVPADQASEKNQPITDDSVVLSKESLAISQSSTVQGAVKVVPIENSDQAQKAIAQVVSSIRENPEAAKQIHGNLAQVNLKQLLE